MDHGQSQAGGQKKLVFMIDYPIGPHWLNYIDLPSIASKYDVTFIEISITFNQSEAFSSRYSELHGSCKVIKVKTFIQLFQSLVTIGKATVVDITVSNLFVYIMINRMLACLNCKRLRVLVNTVPPAKIDEKHIRNRIQELSGFPDLLTKVFRKILYMTRNKLRAFVYYDFYALGGLCSQNLIDTRYGKIIYTVGFDFINSRSTISESPSDGEYALFIEESFFNDTDFILTGSPQSADPRLYFPALSMFLRAVSDKFSIPVKVAPHPKTNVEDFSRQLGSFEILNVPTAEAVKFSAFVLTHSSTAISYALLAQKPIMFFLCAGLSERVGTFQMAQREMLDLPVLSLEELHSDTPISLSKFTASPLRAQKYIDSHVAHPRASTFSFLEVVDQAANS